MAHCDSAGVKRYVKCGYLSLRLCSHYSYRHPYLLGYPLLSSTPGDSRLPRPQITNPAMKNIDSDLVIGIAVRLPR
jgi:hypothetical protein